jgi:hypothetical protein
VVHTASYSLGTVLHIPTVQSHGHETDHSLPSDDDIVNVWSSTATDSNWKGLSFQWPESIGNFWIRNFFFFFNFLMNVPSSCLNRESIVSKTLFIIPTDAQNYKIIGQLKTIKIPAIAPTCFGSRRNHHQGAISCLAKTKIMIPSSILYRILA